MRCFCNLRVDAECDNKEAKQGIKELNDLLTNALTEWVDKMVREKGIHVDVGWNWSKNISIEELYKGE